MRLQEELLPTAEEHIKYRILANIGLAHYELENFNESVIFFEKALKFCKPDNDQILALLAMGYELIGDKENAVNYLQKAIDKNPSNSLANGILIKINRNNSTLEELINLVPIQCRIDVNVLANLGDAALDKKESSEAEKYFKQAIDATNGNTKQLKLALSCALLMPYTEKVPLFLIGHFDSEKQEKLEQAVQLLTDILDNTIPNPNKISKIHLKAIINRSGALWLLGRTKEAIRDIEIALQVEPDNPQLIRQYAELLYRSDNVKQAIIELKKIAIDLQNPKASMDLALMLLEQKSFQEAEYLLDKIIDQDSDLERKRKAQQKKIFMYRELNKYQEASTLAKQLIEKDPNNIINIIEYIYTIIATNNDESLIKELLECCRNLVKNDNIDLISLFYLAVLFEDLKYYRDAAAIYEKFVDTKLNNELTNRLLNVYFYSGNFKSSNKTAK